MGWDPGSGDRTARQISGTKSQESGMTTTDYAKARRLLARRDPIIAGLMKRHGPCGLANAQHEDAFSALTHAIISQQLSTKAAATIARSFDALFDGPPTPAAVARLTDEQ